MDVVSHLENKRHTTSTKSGEELQIISTIKDRFVLFLEPVIGPNVLVTKSWKRRDIIKLRMWHQERDHCCINLFSWPTPPPPPCSSLVG